MRRSLFASLHQKFGTRLAPADRAAYVRANQEKLATAIRAANTGLQKLAEGRTRRKSRVVVIGGGFAGLYAAAELLQPRQSGPRFEVTLLEASPRLGGRVLSDPSVARGRLVEVGAELIGLNHSLWIKLCRDFGLGLVWLSPEEQGIGGLESPYYVDGKRLDEAAQKDLYEELEALNQSIEDEADAVRNPYEPWRAKNALELDSTSATDWILRQQASTRAMKALTADLENNNASLASKQSWLANLALVAGARGADTASGAYWNRTENARCDSGNQALAGALAERVVTLGGEIELKTPAVRIGIDEYGAVVTTGGPSGREVEADFIVLAAPPSVWSKIAFDGVDVSEGAITMGPALKYLSVVDSRFWLKSRQTPNAFNNRLGQTWEATENHMALRGQEFVFSLFAGGRSASRARKADDVDAYMSGAFEEMYPGFAERFVRGRMYDWTAGRWSGGGYSCPAPGEVCTAGRFLSTTPRNRLVFAGEHTCMAFFGYMEGALQSGRVAAERVTRLALAARPARYTYRR